MHCVGVAIQPEKPLGVLPSEHPRERYLKSSVKALGDGQDIHTARMVLKLCISWLVVVVSF